MNLKRLSEGEQIAEVKKNPKFYLSIENPTEKVSMVAVSKKYELLEHVKDKTDLIIQAALKKSGNAIHYLSNPTEEQMMTAVRKTPTSFQYIENPTEKVQLEAIRLSASSNFQRIENPSYQVCKEAVRMKGGLLRNVPKAFKTEEICLEAVKRDGKSLRYVPAKMRSDGLIKAAINETYQALASLKKVSAEQAWLGVKQNVHALIYLKGCIPDALYEELAEYVVTHDEEGLQCVENPSEAIVKKALTHSIENVKHMPSTYWTKELLWQAVRHQVFFQTREVDSSLFDERICLEMLKYSTNVLGIMDELNSELTLTTFMGHGFHYRTIPNFPEEFKLMFIQRHGRIYGSVNSLEFNQKEWKLLHELKKIPSRSYQEYRKSKVEVIEAYPSYLFDFTSDEQDYRSTRLAVRLDPKLAIFSPYFVSNSEELDERNKKLYRSLS